MLKQIVGCCLFAGTLTCSAGWNLVPMPRSVGERSGVVRLTEGDVSSAIANFTRRQDIPDEGYELDISAQGVRISASSDAGAFYAGETLRQLMWVSKDGTVPCSRIVDAPKFKWRGVMLDESRHFFGKETVLRLLESMARYKLNVFHWHLTDREGWRIPIPGYPALVQTVRPVENRRNFRDLDATGTYGPHAYTRTELQEIVEHARRLHIRIVPEIEIPGHSRALLKACPEFRCTVPESAGGKRVDDVCCVGKDRTIAFFERALDEFCDIFPDAVVHIGGDECDREDWKLCADCQARMRANGLKDVAELQSWTTAHFERYLAAKGRRLIGWDEIAEGGLPPSAMVMSWRGTETGIVAARKGHDVVMTPNEFCYLDYEQCIEDDVTVYDYNFTIPVPMAKVYAFDPLKGIPADCARFVLGAQANNWTEMTCRADELEWKTWPRAAAMAEVLWSYPAKRDFPDFQKRLAALEGSWAAAGVAAAPVVPKLRTAEEGRLERKADAAGETWRYACGDVAADFAIRSGQLTLAVSGRPVRTFRGEFFEIDCIRPDPRSYFLTARRKGCELVVTVLLRGREVSARDRGDYLPDIPVPLDIQKRIDDVHARGGGEVVIEPGTYETKPFVLKSNVTLNLREHAVVFASTNGADYSSRRGERCFVFADGAENVAIIGKGVLKGRGWVFRESKPLPGESQPQDLPVMIRLSRCRNVTLEDFTYRDCGAWGCHLRNCDGVTMRRVKCFSHVNNTNDGIDIESSNVLIDDCDIDSNDDAVVFKTESDKSFAVTNVTVRKCRLASCCNAVKFGTGSYCDFRDIRIENCTFVRAKANHGFAWHERIPGVTNRICGIAGLALEVVDGGRMENVVIRNIAMEGYQTPIFIRQHRRHEPAPGHVSYLRNVLIEHVKGVADSRIACSITGVPGLRPHGIVLRDIDLTFPGGGTRADAEYVVPELETVYPESNMFERQPLPAYGFYLRHVDDVTFSDVRLRLRAPDARPPVVADDCTNIDRESETFD